MKKYLYFLSIAAAALVSCTKEKTEDTIANLTCFEKGVRIVASAEQSKVSVDLVGEPGSLLSQMNWQVGDHITLFHNGKTYDFMTSSSGPVATFYPVNESDVIYYISEDEPIAAYYNVTSVAADGKATFSIPAEQTEKDLSNKVPLYTYASTADIYDDCLELIFKPLASVLEFKVSASLAPISATLPSSDDFSYELTKVVLTPKDGASGYTVFNSATIDPATGTITPSGASLSPVTLNFPTPANIAVEEGRHFQMIVGKCEMNNTGVTMDWYKGDILNYTKTLWMSQDVDLISEPTHVYQPIKDKVVGLSNYTDYYSKFYGNRNTQDNFINICDDEQCEICSNPSRDASTVCVVENVQDVMALENTMQYRGLYHVLGGVISPIDGIGPSDLQIESLVERVRRGGVGEVILALSPTMEGDTTNYYIYRKLEDTGVKVTVIARGIAQNDELQYTDEVTLGRALAGRIPFGQ